MKEKYKDNKMKGRVFLPFTLIELLIVVAIIMILAGLLFPALSNAKYRAKQMQCLSHLKQMGTAIFCYSSDKNDFFPGYMDVGFFFNDMEPYTGVKSGVKTAVEAKFYWCPSDSYRVKYMRPAYSYGANYYMAWNNVSAGMRKLTQIRNPSRKIYRTDSKRTVSGSEGMQITFSVNTYPISLSGSIEAAIDFPHLSQCNCLFVDMHVSSSKYYDLCGNTADIRNN